MKNSVTKILWIASLLFIWLVWGCGSRKVILEQSKEETKTETVDNSVIEKQVDTNIKSTTTIIVNDKDEVLSTEEEIKPLDSSKPSLFTDKEGKQIQLNNSIYTKKTETRKNNTQNSVVQNNLTTQKESEKEQKSIEKKQEIKKQESKKSVDKKQFNPINYFIGFAIFIIILVIAYFVLKRLKVI